MENTTTNPDPAEAPEATTQPPAPPKKRILDIDDDVSFARADALVRQFLQGDAARTYAHEHWRCTQCHEPLEGQFTECWNCGAARPVPAETPRC